VSKKSASQIYPLPPTDLIFKSEHVFEWLRWLRSRHGFSQRDLGATTDIAQSEIQKIEAGKQECRLSTFVKLCAELGVPGGWMLDLMMVSNVGLFYRVVKADKTFGLLMKAMEIEDSSLKDTMAMHLGQSCVLAAILLRCSAPIRRAAVVPYPTEDLQRRYLAFAKQIEEKFSPVERATTLYPLREFPMTQLHNLDLLSRETLALKREHFFLPKSDKRKRTFAWDPAVLTFDDVAKMWGIEDATANGGKKVLPSITVSGNNPDVKPTMSDLLKRLNKATAERGMKSKLAQYMSVPLPNVSQWLSGEREPSGETTLRLLAWVESQERK
jgi:transcriptional regulator with XRE-family HTH domain